MLTSLIRGSQSRLLNQELSRIVQLRSFAFKTTDEESVPVPEKDLFITKEESLRFIRECMEKVGTPRNKADRISRNLVEADVRGHFSHGLNRLCMYVDDAMAGTCDPSADPKVIKEGPSTAWVDGCNGLGVVVGEFSMNLAMTKAKESGVGWVAANNSNHFGMCQWYTEMALDNDLIGIAATNTSPLVTPTRAKNVMFGTNPISIGARKSGGSDEHKFLLDMSTSAVAVGKIEIQMRKKLELPSQGWALGSDGQPTTDAKEAFYSGAGLLPLGGAEINSGYKGYGLGMMVELLCGILAGSSYGPNIRKWTNHDVAANLGQCFIALDPDRFAPGFGDRLAHLIDLLHALDPVDPDKPVLVPGEPERICAEHVKQIGAIKYTPDHIITYRQLAQRLGVDPMTSANLN